MDKNKKITVGLDLGTDKCCITYQDSIGRAFIITDEKKYNIPSIIGILNNGLLVGNDLLKDNIYDIPIITSLKRLIGYKSSDNEAKLISSYNNWLLEDIYDNEHFIDLVICIKQHKYKLNDLFCVLLNKLKQLIISHIGDHFNVIITIPANFNEGQKNKILSYCKQCDIECKRFIYEPCSAALTYVNYFNDTEDELKHIIVFDFGAGTLDLAIVTCNSIKDEETNSIEWMTKIESHVGDNNLGGIDIDIMLSNYLEEKYPAFKTVLQTKKETSNFIIEKIKIKLSNLYESNNILDINLIERYYDIILMINIHEYFTLLDIHFKNKIINLLDRVHSSKIKKQEIDTILLIGGSCYNPWIKLLIESYYNKQINEYKLNLSDHLETYNLDIKDIGVSLGATCLEKKIDKNGNLLILTESLPLTIGIDTINNIMCKIIPKGSLIPITVKKYFTTSIDNQKMFEVKLYQGERDDIRDNFFLGSFIIDNLEPEPQGKIVIIITISISTDGLITVDGKIKNTDKYNKRIIINRYNIEIDDQIINNNIIQYEINDYVFNSIIKNYYILITMLNKLQYNLIDNVINKIDDDKIIEIFDIFWEDLINIYILMEQSDKLKTNIEQLKKFILYVKIKFNLQSNLQINEYTPSLDVAAYNLINDKIIGLKLETLNKHIEKNLNYLVTNYQIKPVDNNSLQQSYDTIDNIKLNQINSINNSTEILTEREKDLLNQVANLHTDKDSKIDKDSDNKIDKEKEFNELLIIIINEINTLPIDNHNKLLILSFIDKYDLYIKTNNDFSLHLINIKNICTITSLIDDLLFINQLNTKIDNINDDNINDFELLIKEILEYDERINL